MQSDERIPNLTSKFKSNNIWPLFCPKTVQNWENTRFRQNISIFDRFLAKNGAKCCLIWILRPGSSSRHIAYHRPPFDMIFRFWFFYLPVYFQNFQIIRASRFLQITHFLPYFRCQNCLAQRNITVKTGFVTDYTPYQAESERNHRKHRIRASPSTYELVWAVGQSGTVSNSPTTVSAVLYWLPTNQMFSTIKNIIIYFGFHFAVFSKWSVRNPRRNSKLGVG